MKKNKFIIIFSILIMAIFTLNIAHADSGWDSSYDSGGYSGGSSWDSGSSWSSSSSWDSGSSSGSYGSEDGVEFFIILLVIAIIITIILIKSKYNLTPNSNNPFNISEKYNDITEEELHIFLPEYTINNLKGKLYNKFIEIQKAWMDFKYDELKELCTDELYNSYKSQLEVLKIKNGKNVMEDFKNRSMRITEVKEENGIIVVTVYLMVTFYDYVINTNTGDITRGTNQSPLTNNYIMQFVRVNNKKKKIDKCPSCGAPIKGKTRTKCEYCDSVIVYDAKDFVLSKKTNINK